jgi:hypothetical protein
LGLPPFHHISERSSQQHGETHLDFRLDPRIIPLHFTLRAATPSLFWSRRGTLIEIFRPSNTPLVLTFGIPNSLNPDLVRSIDVFVEKGLSLDTAKRKDLNQDFDVVLRAPDPTFYDPTEKTLVLHPLHGDGYKHGDPGYGGSWYSYPIIEIEGPFEDPTITNIVTGEKLALTYHVAAGETVTIDTNYGVKTVMNQAGTNLIGYLTDDSDLATFRLVHDSVEGNDLSINGTVPAGGATSVTFSYYDRFIGI